MNLFTNLRNALLGISGVTAIVGSNSATTRIWNSWPRTYTVPCLVMDIDTETEQPYLATGSGEGIVADVTITCRAGTHDVSDALQEAVRHGLAGYAGTFDAILNQTVHSETPKSEGSTEHWYDHVCDYTMIWTEAA